jgi:hypothetical protein
MSKYTTTHMFYFEKEYLFFKIPVPGVGHQTFECILLRGSRELFSTRHQKTSHRMVCTEGSTSHKGFQCKFVDLAAKLFLFKANLVVFYIVIS